MKFYIIVIVIFFSNSVYSQQFNFQSLLSMINDIKVFEKNMISVGNNTIEVRDYKSYSYALANGTIGATFEMPTNNIKYDLKWKFKNGNILYDREIDSLHLDDSFELRNKMRSEGQPLNINEVIGFTYVNSKLKFLTESDIVKSKFAENFNNETKMASTFYDFKQTREKVIIPNSNFGKAKNEIELEVFFVRENDYLRIMRQISQTCTYLKTDGADGDFTSHYIYGKFAIQVQKDNRDNIGGTIKIISPLL